MTEASMSPNYTAVELSTLLGINVKTVYKAAAAGEIPCRRVLRRFVFPRAAVDAWLATTPAPARLTERPRRRRPVRRSSRAGTRIATE